MTKFSYLPYLFDKNGRAARTASRLHGFTALQNRLAWC